MVMKISEGLNISSIYAQEPSSDILLFHNCAFGRLRIMLYDSRAKQELLEACSGGKI